MATNQRIAHLIAIVCLSLLTVIPTVRLSYAAGAAVTVTNPSSSPVPTQNVGGGAATHVGQPVSHLVSLDCRTSANSTKPCTGPDRNPFSPPAGKALVVTDVQFFGIFQPGQGDYALVELSLQNETGFRGTLFSA